LTKIYVDGNLYNYNFLNIMVHSTFMDSGCDISGSCVKRASEDKNSAQLKNKTTILIVDDHPLVRHALKDLIEGQNDMEVIGEAENGKEAVGLTRRLLPDMVIMDIGMPIMNGLEATRQIKTQCPGIAVLVLTVHTDREHVIGILEAGAAGYLTKVIFGDEVIKAIRAIAGGETVLTPSVLKEVLNQTHPELPKSNPARVNNLTTKEIKILKLAARGLSNKYIALELGISENTVKSYLGDVFGKLNVGSRIEAVMLALRSGIITSQDLEDQTAR
jgi:DNA-binding NarL/FixJ family response regulator